MDKNMMRLTFDVTRELHKTIKLQAIDHNCTMKQYIMQAIVEKLTRDQLFNSKGVSNESAFDGNNAVVFSESTSSTSGQGNRGQ